MGRKAKRQDALDALKASIDLELGPGAGNTVFRNLHIKSNVSVGEMGAVKQEFDRLKAGLGRAGRALPAQHFELAPVKGQPSMMAGRLSQTADPTRLQGMTDDLDRRLGGLQAARARPRSPSSS